MPYRTSSRSGRFGLLISCEEYLDTRFIPTPYCHRDAYLLQETLVRDCGYKIEDITHINLNEQNDIKPLDVLKEIEALSRNIADAESVLFFFSGHGDLKDGVPYIILPGTIKGDYEETAIKLQAISDILRPRDGVAIRVIDACHSGHDVRGSSPSGPQEFVRAITEIPAVGWATLAACRDDEYSHVDESKGYGVFTGSLCEAISEVKPGAAIYPELIKVSTCAKVMKWAAGHGKSQTPTIIASISGNVSLGTRSGTPRSETPQPAWRLVVSEGMGIGKQVFSSRMRIPVWKSILLTQGVRRIIDSQDFQRLRGVRQLGPTLLVYPGAVHTRFEHSLGVYWLALRYMEKLCALPRFNELCPDPEEAVTTLVLASLLHDLGHYPFSHWIEEVGQVSGLTIEKHEARSKSIVEGGALKKIIKEEWGDVDLERVYRVIDQPGTDKTEIFLHSILSSIIDIDKLDYLIRDSVHCGVEYGEGIDAQRLIECLEIDVEYKHICVNEKGRALVQALLACRNLMYQDVYWHKTVRACDSMFKRAFFEIADNLAPHKLAVLQRALEKSDAEFLRALADFADSKELKHLLAPFVFEGRGLYKLVYLDMRSARRKNTSSERFFELVLSDRSSYGELVSLSKRLATTLSLKPTEILIDRAPVKDGQERDKDEVPSVRIINHRTGKPEDFGDATKTMSRFLEENQQSYIYCHPAVFPRLEMMSTENWEEVFARVLSQV